MLNSSWELGKVAFTFVTIKLGVKKIVEFRDLELEFKNRATLETFGCPKLGAIVVSTLYMPFKSTRSRCMR